MQLKDIKLYRMVHIDNIPHILQYGITHRQSAEANPHFIAIGDATLILTRDKRYIEIDNGESSKSSTTFITLGDFIPFYFGVRMPMLYVIQKGGNFVEKATAPENIIYLVCALADVTNLPTTYYFTDGHATDRLTSFYDSSKLFDLPNIINWDAIKTRQWAGNDNLDIKRQKQAEFLVDSNIPSSFIVGFGCYNNQAKEKLTAFGCNSDKIKIIPQSYY
jgi:hypothetical protein